MIHDAIISPRFELSNLYLSEFSFPPSTTVLVSFPEATDVQDLDRFSNGVIQANRRFLFANLVRQQSRVALNDLNSLRRNETFHNLLQKRNKLNLPFDSYGWVERMAIAMIAVPYTSCGLISAFGLDPLGKIDIADVCISLNAIGTSWIILDSCGITELTYPENVRIVKFKEQ